MAGLEWYQRYISTRSLRHLPRALQLTDGSASCFTYGKRGVLCTRSVNRPPTERRSKLCRACDTHSISRSVPSSLTTEWCLPESARRGIVVQLLYGETEKGAKLATLGTQLYQITSQRFFGTNDFVTGTLAARDTDVAQRTLFDLI